MLLRNVGLPNKMDSMKPPKLESKFQCSIMHTWERWASALEFNGFVFERLFEFVANPLSLTSPVSLADKDTAVAAILKKAEIKQGRYVFNIPTVANSTGVAPSELLNHLQNLKVKGEITYEVKDPAHCYKIVEVPCNLCSLSALLTWWLSDIDNCNVIEP
ncbi:hypothetical protein REPUB_Repub01dG0077000 [Reevesia pubescens]